MACPHTGMYFQECGTEVDATFEGPLNQAGALLLQPLTNAVRNRPGRRVVVTITLTSIAPAGVQALRSLEQAAARDGGRLELWTQDDSTTQLLFGAGLGGLVQQASS